MGAASIEALIDGQRNVMIGIENNKIVYVPFTKAIKNDKPIKKELVNVLNSLSI
jgi:6-phosphofructokinase 1